MFQAFLQIFSIFSIRRFCRLLMCLRNRLWNISSYAYVEDVLYGWVALHRLMGIFNCILLGCHLYRWSEGKNNNFLTVWAVRLFEVETLFHLRNEWGLSTVDSNRNFDHRRFIQTCSSGYRSRLRKIGGCHQLVVFSVVMSFLHPAICRQYPSTLTGMRRSRQAISEIPVATERR